MTGVHPTVVLGPGVELGERVTIGPYTTITGPCEIGDEVWIGPHASIGTPAEIRGGPHPAFDEGGGQGVQIGSRTILRDFVVVNQGSIRPTIIGADGYLMDRVHIGHDVQAGDRATMAPGAGIGGHCWFGGSVTIGMGAVLHQFGVIGGGAMVGMQAAITHPVPPFALARGVPGRVTGVNRVGLERLGFDRQVVDDVDARLRAGEVGGEGIDGLDAYVVAYRSALAQHPDG